MSNSTVTRKYNRHQRVQTLVARVVGGAGSPAGPVRVPERVTIGTAEGNDLVVADPTVSRYHLELNADASGVRVVDLRSTNGTHVGNLLVERAIVPPGTVIRVGDTEILVDDAERTVIELHTEDALGGLRGRTPSMRRLMARVLKIAGSDAAVLLMGESGTGKELIARAIHENSERADGPCITVDCGALPRGLVSSELFGHEKGAFTGALARRKGAFERAHGGTLFLDEIGELPLELQSYLLGAIERGRFPRVGGTEEVEVDVRTIAATNRDLREEVNHGRFRLDLFYRVAVASIEVPPLRERVDDIPLLVEHFLSELGRTLDFDTFVDEADAERLRSYRWPGNVRELRNLVETAIVMDEQLSAPIPDDGRPATEGPDLEQENALSYREARALAVGRFERRYLVALLERADGNVSLAARLARMNRSHLSEMIGRHGLRKRS